jgi:O-antigen/teichoic acid export membrane protein
MSRARSLESLYLATQPLILNIINLPTQIYVVRVQGDASFGQLQTAMTLTATFGVFSYLGLRPYFVRAVAQQPESLPERLSEQLGLRLLLAFVSGLAMIATCLALGHSRLVVACTVVGAVTNMFSALVFCFSDVLEGTERFLAYTNATFIGGLLLSATTIAMSVMGLGLIALSMAYLVGPLVSALIMGLCVHRQTRIRPTWRPARMKALLRESRMQARANLLGSIEDRIEALILPKAAGYANNGVFAAGSMPASRLVTVPYGLTSFYFPRIARRHGKQQDLNETITHMLTLLLLLTVPATLGIGFLSEWVAGLQFPKDPDLCARVMRVTAWSLPLAALGSGLMTALQASGRIDKTARLEVVSILLGFAAAAVLVPRWGIWGGVMSWLARAALNSGLLLPLFWRTFRKSLRDIPWLRIAAACLAMQGTFWLSERFDAGLGPAMTLVAGAVLGTVAYTLVLLVTGVLTRRRVSAMLTGGRDHDDAAGEVPVPQDAPTAAQ